GGNPTPTGFFFVTDNVTLANPNSAWGPHALGLSARSETITEFNGGDGIVGIHGTNRPESIGEAASLGCVRVPNEVIVKLHEMIQIGTPVPITSSAAPALLADPETHQSVRKHRGASFLCLRGHGQVVSFVPDPG